MNSLFIINPRSGRSQNLKLLLAQIEAAMSSSRFDGRIHVTDSIDELDGLLEPGRLEPGLLVWAIGGDGTVSAIGRRLIGTSAVLALVPAGSGNGLARHLGVPMQPANALSLWHEGEVTSIDSGIVNGIPFLGTFGLGFDAVIAHRFAEAGSRGLETYVREGVRAFFSYQPETYELEIDGVPVVETAFVLTVANSSQYGNDARIAPLASLRDGLLDVCSLRQVPALSIPDVVQKLFLGRLDQCSHLVARRGRVIRITRERGGAAHIDGEPLELSRELRVEVRPRSLNVLIPPRREALI
jgi:diacylglycerol kinase (ATP)